MEAVPPTAVSVAAVQQDAIVVYTAPGADLDEDVPGVGDSEGPAPYIDNAEVTAHAQTYPTYLRRAGRMPSDLPEVGDFIVQIVGPRSLDDMQQNPEGDLISWWNCWADQPKHEIPRKQRTVCWCGAAAGSCFGPVLEV